MNFRILVPLDGSSMSEQALPAVRKLAIGLAPCTVELFYVVDPSLLAIPADGGLLPPSSIKRTEEWAKAYLEEQAKALTPSGIEVQATVSMGPPAGAILDHLRAGEFDYVLMATHGRSGLARAIVGSVTDRVIREAAVPVIAVHPQPVAAAGDPWPGADAAAPELIQMFARGDLLSSQAVDILAKRGAAVVPDLVSALSSNRAEVRRYAARTLGAIGTTQAALNALVSCITDEAFEVRWEAEEALVRFGASGIEAVLESITHRTADVRYNQAVLHVIDRAPMEFWQALRPVARALRSHESAMTAPIEAERALRVLKPRQPLTPVS